MVFNFRFRMYLLAIVPTVAPIKNVNINNNPALGFVANRSSEMLLDCEIRKVLTSQNHADPKTAM